MQKIIKGYITYKDIKNLPIGSIVSLSPIVQKKFCSLSENDVENGFLRYMGEIFVHDMRLYIFFNETERTYREFETYLAMDVLDIEKMHQDNFQDLFKEEMPEMFEECMILVEPLLEHLDKTIEGACMIYLSLLNENLEENLKENEVAISMKKVIKECIKLKKLIEKKFIKNDKK